MKIPLSQGKFALVGPRDYEYLMQWNWCYDRGYAVRATPRPKQRKIYMHRVILERMGFEDFEEGDHINRNTLDNHRGKLRPATRKENVRNRGVQRNNTTGCIGVSWYKRLEKWRSRIGVDGEDKHLGCFDTKEEAKRVRDEAARKYHGEFAVLNKE
jgi:hypothetical protein